MAEVEPDNVRTVDNCQFAVQLDLKIIANGGVDRLGDNPFNSHLRSLGKARSVWLPCGWSDLPQDGDRQSWIAAPSFHIIDGMIVGQPSLLPHQIIAVNEAWSAGRSGEGHLGDEKHQRTSQPDPKATGRSIDTG
ncbi:MAG: hypothetical protein EOR86_17785 [Mesorhizobium sp.]|nr:MAG: hypothetical protein EOR86_17785 [Mesorhizobium sp.]